MRLLPGALASLAVLAVMTAGEATADPALMVKAKEKGYPAQNCQYCHGSTLPTLNERGQWLASELRFQNVVEKYQTTSHTPEALYRLTESSLALGLPSEAKKYAAVLGSNYPGSQWYQRAFRLMQDYAPNATAS